MTKTSGGGISLSLSSHDSDTSTLESLTVEVCSLITYNWIVLYDSLFYDSFRTNWRPDECDDSLQTRTHSSKKIDTAAGKFMLNIVSKNI